MHSKSKGYVRANMYQPSAIQVLSASKHFVSLRSLMDQHMYVHPYLRNTQRPVGVIPRNNWFFKFLLVFSFRGFTPEDFTWTKIFSASPPIQKLGDSLIIIIISGVRFQRFNVHCVDRSHKLSKILKMLFTRTVNYCWTTPYLYYT